MKITNIGRQQKVALKQEFSFFIILINLTTVFFIFLQTYLQAVRQKTLNALQKF
jgi:hypothetical protein